MLYWVLLIKILFSFFAATPGAWGAKPHKPDPENGIASKPLMCVKVRSHPLPRFVVCHSGFCFFVFLIFSGWGMSMVVRLFNFKISCNVLVGAIEFLMLVCFSAVMICLV